MKKNDLPLTAVFLALLALLAVTLFNGSESFASADEMQPIIRAPMNIEIEMPKAADYYTAANVEMLARLMWSECRGVPSETERAAVVWCVLNRVDAGGFGDSIKAVVTAKNQFAYSAASPLDDGLYKTAEDVLKRWAAEKDGETDSGRVLPTEYLYFYGKNGRNHFRTEWRGGLTYDWALNSPYED